MNLAQLKAPVLYPVAGRPRSRTGTSRGIKPGRQGSRPALPASFTVTADPSGPMSAALVPALVVPGSAGLPGCFAPSEFSADVVVGTSPRVPETQAPRAEPDPGEGLALTPLPQERPWWLWASIGLVGVVGVGAVWLLVRSR